LARYEDSLAVPNATGDVADLPLYAGQSAGLADGVRSAGEVVPALAEEAETTIESLGRLS
jgi:nitronate monooxygenase